LIRFSTEARQSSSDWINANMEGRQRALGAVDELRATGGTNLAEALQLVKKLAVDKTRVQSVFLLTDGKPTIGERDEGRLVQQAADTGLRFFTFGIGNEINTHLLDKMAQQSFGTRTYVHPAEDIEVKVSHLFQKIQSPVLTDVHLSGRGITFDAMHPKRLGDLFAGAQLSIVATYHGRGSASLTLAGRVGEQEKQFFYDLNLPQQSVSHPFIPQLWATRRVGFLLDQIRLHGSDKKLVDEIVRPGEALWHYHPIHQLPDP